MRFIAATVVLAVLNVGSILDGADGLPEPKPQPQATTSGQGSAGGYRAGEADESPKSGASENKDASEANEAIEQAITVFRRTTAQQGLRIDSAGVRRSSVSSGSLWHGRVYEYLRNDALDATPHEIVQNGGDQNLLRRNQYGFSLSGPVVLPKLYDGRRSTFFTFSYEATREKVGRSYLRTLPSIGQRLGDFSDLVDSAGNPILIYDPSSTRPNPAYDPTANVSETNLEYERDPFPNNLISPTRLDRTALAMAEHYPQPNTNIGPFLTNNYFTNPVATNRPAGFVSRVDQSVGDRHKVTVDMARSRGFIGEPRIYDTIANPGRPDRDFLDRHVTVTETFAVSPNAVYESSFRAYSSVVETTAASDGRNLPQELGLDGVNGSVFPMLRFNHFYGMGASRGRHHRNAHNYFQFRQLLSLHRGDHQLAFSGGVTRVQLNTLELDAPSGDLGFDDELTGLPGVTNTGSSYASYLLGLASTAVVTDQPQPSYLRRTTTYGNLRDQIELTRNLTATVNLRVDVETPHVEKYDRRSTIDLDQINSENGLPGALVFANRDGYGRGFQPVRVSIEPYLGISWSPTTDRETVVRASVRRYGYGVRLRSGAFGTQGFSAVRQPVSPNTQLAPAVVLSDGFEPLDTSLPNLDASAANGMDADLVPSTARQPQVSSATFSVEQRLPSGLILRANGRFDKGAGMLASDGVAGINRVSTDALAYRDQLNDEAFRSQLRPYPQFQQLMSNGQYPMGKYRSESGEVSLEKRMTSGLTFDASYRYRRSYDNYSSGAQDPDNRQAEWAYSRGRRPHAVSLSYLYEIPIGQGSSLLGGSGIVGKVLGGWSVSGFTSWRSGDPIMLSPQFNNTGGVVPYLRVNTVAGVDPAVESPGPEMWFNPAAFSNPADFELGNAARTYPSLSNPSWQNHDLAVSKRVPLSSEQSVELLFQTFNFINHANWNDPDAQIGTSNAPNLNAGRIIGSTGGRVMQLGARYNF